MDDRSSPTNHDHRAGHADRPCVLHGVGVGPGDPDLVTVRASELLAGADVVFVPVLSPERTGHAERVALHYAEAWRIEQVVLGPHDRAVPGRREVAWAAAVRQVASWLESRPGALAVFATTGDVCLHSAFPRFARCVQDEVAGLRVELTPGISPMQALAARDGRSLAEPGETLAVLPGTVDDAGLRTALKDFDCVVVERVGGRLDDTARMLGSAGRLTRAIHGSSGGQPIPLGLPDHPSDPLPYLSTVIASPSSRGSAEM
ncbi:precorrin-2 C(20)-methyltransferase [Pseudonocardia endophytica]|uniref:Precorrin-2 C20-methyltransferase /cobalt-factor II C20-methyltransferase n=1 Tax=Pseudonocardia endophytica TaxID=401976 RepID=A0A4R1HGP7_PSEEN|nr:precorrin-2 C(20)-methyltransferase [Pseudonocardia endophytica]TCK21337.1 precorrin-2 C20-methyltransferase /cobalt-factor II C20-methyltransferase [Pseudonocardia endophytica]